MRKLKKGAGKEEPLVKMKQEGAGRSNWWLAINLLLGAGWWQNKPSCWATSTPRSPSKTSTLPLSGGHFKSLSLQYWGQRIQHLRTSILRSWRVFLQCEWGGAFSDLLLEQMTSYILSKCGSSLHCEWACAFSGVQLDQMTSDIEHKCIFFRELPFASSAFVLDLFFGGSKVFFYLNCLPE